MVRSFSKALFLSVLICSSVFSQERLPDDNGLTDYHPAPNYRESESHPLRIVAYILHPIGWVLREGIFRPWSYIVSSNETRASVFGYREPYAFRKNSCFTMEDYDCRKIPPYDYASRDTGAAKRKSMGDEAEVYFPDVNFDFDKRSLNETGKARAVQVAELLKKKQPGVTVILEGHTDARGSDSYNNKLGMDRAQAVRAALIANGLPETKLAAVTFGETKPKMAGTSDEAYSANRRVEVKLDNSKLEAN